MVPPIQAFLAVGALGALLVPLSYGAVDPQLTGTWTTKSRKVVTGPGFYDPVNEKMFEPPLTGFSYSFTDDGYFEEAYYRAISNPTNPECPQGIIQWQHGKYQKNANGSLSLFPFEVDGRQLLSDPCSYHNSVFTRYKQFELFKDYQVLTDPYSKALRLNLFGFDGAPLNPMYLAYKPPQMLPTQTLNPTATDSGGGAAKSTGKVKRSVEGLESFFEEPLDREALIKRREPIQQINADKWWWIGVTMTGLGGLVYYCF
ncbi:Reversal of tor2 lethality [Lecanora helva]